MDHRIEYQQLFMCQIKRFFQRLACSLMLVISCPFYIQAESALDKLFESLNIHNNASAPGSYKDQQAGYYTGGGVMMRADISGFSPIQVSLPAFNVGCGKIDAHLGSLSFMKSGNMIRSLKAMGVGIGTYAFQLALKTVAPQIESTFSQLRKILLEINQMQLGDCRMVQQMVTSALPKDSEMYRHACTDVNSKGSEESDWFGAKAGCKESEQAFAKAKEVGASEREAKTDSFDMRPVNFTWHALYKMSGLSDEMKEFIMTLVGTIIKKEGALRPKQKEPSGFQYHYVAGMADNRAFIESHLKGGETEVLVCDSKTDCLNPRKSKVIYSASEGGNPCMTSKIHVKILSLQNKYLNKGTLLPDEIGFLNDSVKLPVWKYIQISSAVGSHFLLNDAVEFIAASVLLAQFERAAAEVVGALDSLQTAQLNDEMVQKLKENIHNTRMRLQLMIGNCNNGALFRLNQMLKTYENEVTLQKGL